MALKGLKIIFFVRANLTFTNFLQFMAYEKKSHKANIFGLSWDFK